MLISDAENLISAAVPRMVAVWADFGAGEGTFTNALAGLLEPGSRIYAVDRDRSTLSWTARGEPVNGVQIVSVVEDFSREFDVGEPARELLDGMLFANSLHFVSNQSAVLARLVAWLRPGGRVIVVEYDQRSASQWVPYPIPRASLPALAKEAGLSEPVPVSQRASEYRGILYSAVMYKPMVHR